LAHLIRSDGVVEEADGRRDLPEDALVVAVQVMKVVMVRLATEVKELALREATSSPMDRVQAQVPGLQTSCSCSEKHQEVCCVA